MKPVFPKGCYIHGIQLRSGHLCASLLAPDSTLLISGLLKYINEQLLNSEIVSVAEFNEKTGMNVKEK
jgi:hypothetical protein